MPNSRSWNSFSVILGVLLVFATAILSEAQLSQPTSLKLARQGFQTKLIPVNTAKEAAEAPPARLFSLVHYDAPVGKLAAYITPDPKDGRKHPAIIWITGGDCNSIGDVWTPESPENDQSASAFRQAGLVMMFPSLRGGNDNPGQKEGFLGEVDDVLAAADYLAKQDYVDPQRIYLGGHSTGGTLVLLTAECSARFRAVFSFGPVGNVASYGADSGFVPFDLKSKSELRVRCPILWLSSVKSPVFVLEGSGQPGNITSLQAMKRVSTNPQIHFYEATGANHFTILAPTTRLIANKILTDTTPTCQLEFSPEELNKPFTK